MTEAEWLTSTEPAPMLEFIENRTSRRKLMLFACACCRTILSLAPSPVRGAFENAERYSDGECSKSEISDNLVLAIHSGTSVDGVAPDHPQHATSMAVVVVWNTIDLLTKEEELVSHITWIVAASATAIDYQNGARNRTFDWECLRTLRGKQALVNTTKILRDIVFPFRPIAVDPRWRTSTVLALADGIYADRAFDRLPILADALEEAGCDSEAILAHCRDDGPHVRGCWVVDLLLGKE